MEGGEGGKGGIKGREREEGWGSWIVCTTPMPYITSIAAAEKRPLSYQTPQSVHMV